MKNDHVHLSAKQRTNRGVPLCLSASACRVRRSNIDGRCNGGGRDVGSVLPPHGLPAPIGLALRLDSPQLRQRSSVCAHR